MSVVVYRIVVPCERMALVPSPHTWYPGQRGGATAGGDGASSLIGRYSKHGVVFVGKLSDYGRYSQALHCASALRWCKRRTPTAIGVDGVKTVGRARGVKAHARAVRDQVCGDGTRAIL